MKTMNDRGFSPLFIVLVIAVVAVIGGVGYYVYRLQNENTNNNRPSQQQPGTNQQDKTTDKTSEKTLSSDWLLRESAMASIRVPDGFNILASDGDPLNFVLPDVPQGTLKYEKGTKAQVVGEPHKHFELGLIASFNQPGLNDRGVMLKEFKTYSGLPVTVKLFKQTTDPTGVGFPKGAKHLKYTVTKGTDFFNIDYVYLGDGIVDIIDEMVKSVTIK